MGKHFNPLEKEFLIRSYRNNGRIKLGDFCVANNVSDSSFKKWLKQYDEGGLEALARADADFGAVLPEGIDRTEESYKREIMKLRIENERLKKNYMVRTNENGEQEFVRLKPKNST
jgi:transposase-like protein